MQFGSSTIQHETYDPSMPVRGGRQWVTEPGHDIESSVLPTHLAPASLRELGGQSVDASLLTYSAGSREEWGDWDAVRVRLAELKLPGGIVIPRSCIRDARLLLRLVEATHLVPPKVAVADDGEIVMEWISADRRAVISVDGSGVAGYATLVGDRFQPGNDFTLRPNQQIPDELVAYLVDE